MNHWEDRPSQAPPYTVSWLSPGAQVHKRAAVRPEAAPDPKLGGSRVWAMVLFFVITVEICKLPLSPISFSEECKGILNGCFE